MGCHWPSSLPLALARGLTQSQRGSQEDAQAAGCNGPQGAELACNRLQQQVGLQQGSAAVRPVSLRGTKACRSPRQTDEPARLQRGSSLLAVLRRELVEV